MEYQHGGDVYSHNVELDYSANINPFGMPERVKEAAARSLEESGRYPDSTCGSLRRALAAFHGVEPGMVVCGNGAADLIFGLVLAMKPRRALVTAPAFSEYEQALDTVGCKTDYLYLREEQGFAVQEAEFTAALESGPELVFLCNPNNPTGVPVSGEMARNMARLCLERNICLAVDECFCDFLPEGDRCSLIPFLRSYPNVFVLKAFTKLYAMAGLRLGYGICADRELLEAVNRVRQPWSVSNVAQAAGLAALDEREYVERSVRRIADERQWLAGKLKDMGLIVYDSRANYIFFRDPWEATGPGIHGEKDDGGEADAQPGPSARLGLAAQPGRRQGRLYEELLRQRILIRSCGNYRGLDSSYYRICVRGREDNRRLAEAMEAALASHRPKPAEEMFLDVPGQTGSNQKGGAGING